MPADSSSEVKFEIGHVLFIDIVGYSKGLINEQSDSLQKLKEIVRGTEQFRLAEGEGKLLRLPTGDGSALVFRNSPEAPVLCAMEIAQTLKSYPELNVRMGIHSGPVNEISDLNEQANIAGAGINMAQRVMDCGDAGHILLSRHVAEDLEHYPRWQPYLHELGECEVKHGVRVAVVSLYTDEIGNSALPEKLRRQRAETSRHSRKRPQAIAAIGVGVALLFSLAGLLYWQHNAQIHRTAENRMAVLPFRPLANDQQDPSLEMGMADSLIQKLSNSRQLIVPSLTTVRPFADRDPVAAGRALGVSSVLEGNLQKLGERLRVTARLIRVADGASLWAETFDEKFTDVFAVQDLISRKVADALSLRLTGAEKKRIAKRYTENVDAYQLYLTGVYHWNKLTPPEIMRSIEFYQRAIEIDPNYALAYFGLAESYRTLSVTSDRRPDEIFPPSKAAALRALELDEALAEAHASLAFNYIWYDWDWARAEQESKRAIELNPNSGFARLAYAHFLSDVARHDEAIAQIRRARELEPASLIVNTLEGAFLYHARRDDEAEERLRKAIELEPRFWVAHLFLGGVQAARKRFDDAAAEYAQARDLSLGNSQAVSMLGYVAAQSGDKVRTQALLDELRARSSYVPSSNIAHLYHSLGDNDQAFVWLAKALQEHDVFMSFLKVDPRWDRLRSDPRFKNLITRIFSSEPR